MRLVLVIAVIALVADALLFSGAYTRAAYRQVAWAANQFVALISDVVDDVDPDPQSSLSTRRV